MALLPDLLPSLADIPMRLGDHLQDLKRRLFWPVVVLCVAFFFGIIFQNDLKKLLVWPLMHAIDIVGVDRAKSIGLEVGTARLLTAFGLGDSIMLSMHVALDAAVIVTIPVAMYHLWMFVAVGLKMKERRLAFLFVPFGVIMFYIGGLIGYFLGLPYLFAWLMFLHAEDPTARVYWLGMDLYHSIFVNMTICFGLILDIPWLVMVLVRVGIVKTAQLSAWRRYVLLVNLVLAAMITPTTDVFTLMAMFLPMQVLFEGGLLASRIMMWRKNREQVNHGG